VVAAAVADEAEVAVEVGRGEEIVGETLGVARWRRLVGSDEEDALVLVPNGQILNLLELDEA